MTRKHFVELAACLRHARPLPTAHTDAWDTWREAVDTIAHWCGLMNPHFDRARFLEACTQDPRPFKGR